MNEKQQTLDRDVLESDLRGQTRELASQASLRACWSEPIMEHQVES